ncbi:hypothetical protein WJX81_004311 [Elliptochloris bilobata]|uniref:ABC1 atypical kinase-like domain-containing protein n=1 Tax=Elliptochloris bilobata TaxID=381761 RepID=A0AAW1SJ58_9CHLO
MRALLAVPLAAFAGWVVSDKDRAVLAVALPTRFIRVVSTAATITSDYKWSLRGLSGAALETQRTACHARGAERLQRLCFANGGVYVKLGQHIAQLDHLMPKEYVEQMRRSMLSRCPVSPFAEVAQTIEADLGSPPSALYASIEETPIASASLAQVHRAVGHDGRALAVKVQHARLRDSCTADILMVEGVVRVAHAIFPDFNYQWLVEEMKHNLPRELDFEVEAANAERCRRNLASPHSAVRGRVHVPVILPHFTSQRVLTMELIEHAADVCDVAAMRHMGVRPDEVAKLVSQTFADMIYLHGYVHADPHQNNLMVRKDSRGRAQLVLLDHGLYRELTDAFRIEYAGLWSALIFGDEAGIKRHAAAMGAADSVPLFAGMLTMRPWDEVTRPTAGHLVLPSTEAGREKIRASAAEYAHLISGLLQRMPREMLLLLKTNDCLRTIDSCLGQDAKSFTITARSALRAVAQQRRDQRPGLRSWAAGWTDWLRVEARLTAFALLSWLAQLRQQWAGSAALV